MMRNGNEPARAWKLHAAIAASCAIHACALVGPYLGSGSPPGIPAIRAAAEPPAPLRARLARMQDAVPADPGPVAPMPGITEVATGPGPVTDVAVAASPLAAVAAPAAPVDLNSPPVEAGSVGLGLLPFDGIAYYASGRLTRRPEPLGEIALDDPALAPVVASGKMIMTLWINALGEVEHAEVEDSELPGLFAGPAVAAFKRLRFLPGELHGRTVGAMMKIEVSFADDRAGAMPPLQVSAGDAPIIPQPPVGHAAYGGDRMYQ